MKYLKYTLIALAIGAAVYGFYSFVKQFQPIAEMEQRKVCGGE